MTPDHDVVVVGDGPAGAAAAAACLDVGLDTVVVGPGNPWPHTYGVWPDELSGLAPETYLAARGEVVVAATTRRRVHREYGVIDNAVLRRHLGLDALLLRDAKQEVLEHRDIVEVRLRGGGSVTATTVVDATGSSGESAPAWQTAYGVVVSADLVRSNFTTEAVTLMDWSVAGCRPTFCYVVPGSGGWLAQETELVAREPVGAMSLRNTLAGRLGEAVVADAEERGQVEEVRIPLGLPVRRGTRRVVRFGAAAGMIHPVTGYSVAGALRAAPALAQAIAAGTDPRAAVWPRSARRTRALHTYGLETLLRLTPSETVEFFESFFSLPVERWSEYVRTDSGPIDVMRAMAALFRSAPRSVRRRLVHSGGDSSASDGRSR